MAEIVANRVGTFAQRSSLVQQMMITQKRLYETQTQLVTEQKSQDYAGIAYDSFRLVSVETERTMVQRFSQGNSLAQVRLESMVTATDAVKETLHNLRNDLIDLGINSIPDPMPTPPNPDDLKKLKDIQTYAFAALQEMTFYLNAEADGRYVFAGGRTDQEAVDLPYATLGEFQDDYDGFNVVYPETRSAHVPDIKLTDDEHDGLAFGPGTMSANVTAPDAFKDIKAGSIIKLSGSDQYFTVQSAQWSTGSSPPVVDGGPGPATPDILTVTPDPSGVAGITATSTLETVSYYNGDDLTVEHRVNERRTIELGINAKDAAFEKAIRGIGILAQGGVDVGTGGGLDENVGRIEKAMNLISDALDHDPNRTNPPIEGDVDRSDLEEVIRRIGFNQVTLDNAIDEARTYDAFLERRQVDVEQANTIDAATRLQDDARALEVSFQSYARISQLTLMKFM